jgi:hypothetical protein
VALCHKKGDRLSLVQSPWSTRDTGWWHTLKNFGLLVRKKKRNSVFMTNQPTASLQKTFRSSRLKQRRVQNGIWITTLNKITKEMTKTTLSKSLDNGRHRSIPTAAW